MDNMKPKQVKRRMSVRLVAAVLLAAAPAIALSGNGTMIKMHMFPTGAEPQARGRVDYLPDENAERIRVRVKRLPEGTYELRSNGRLMTTFEVLVRGDGRTAGQVTLSTADASLTMEPRGTRLTVESDGVVYLTTDMPMDRDEARTLEEVRVELTNTGEDPDASGQARWWARKGRERFKVTVDDLEKGTYELRVGENIEGLILVDGMGEGSIRLDTRPWADDSDGKAPLLLTFDPRNKSLQITREGRIFLEGLVTEDPDSNGAGGQAPGSGGSSGAEGPGSLR